MRAASRSRQPDKNVGTPPVRMKKSEMRREAILRHALTIFDKQGFANTSLDDIAKANGIKREAIYYYFNNRAEILLALIRPQSESLVAGLRKIANSDLPAREKLYGAIRNHLERFDRHCLEMTIALRDIYLEDAREVRKEMDQTWRSYESIWTKIILGGQNSGEFVKCGDAKMIAFAILGMCNWLARWYDPAKSTSIEQLIHTYFSIVTTGLDFRPGKLTSKLSSKTSSKTAAKAPARGAGAKSITLKSAGSARKAVKKSMARTGSRPAAAPKRRK